jgi:hypothetical protein
MIQSYSLCLRAFVAIFSGFVMCYVKFHQLLPVIWKLGNRNDDIIN